MMERDLRPEVEYEEVDSYLWYVRYPEQRGGGMSSRPSGPETHPGGCGVAVQS